MLTIACSACQKKLAVKEDAVGKKVKCPGCGQVTVVSAKTDATVGGVNEQQTVSLAPDREMPTLGPAQADATHSPREKPDATQAVKPQPSHDSSLTDFLAPPQAADELGRLGKYRILKILGHGGMGVVFLGEDPKLGRKVAIKAMLPHLAESKSSQQRFLREARTAATLEHDHIVPIFQVDEDRGAPYIVMPLLKGEPLDERLKRDKQLPLPEILRIGREIAAGLAAAHATGLVHRDIKPANIWLEQQPTRARQEGEPLPDERGSYGRVKILDFGLARAVSEDSGLTQQGAIIGTPAYMAPEQGRGETVDARCDLFSLGVVLYRMCTGKAPFRGKDTVSTLVAVATHDPGPPIGFDAALPKELSDLVMKLLKKSPADRIGSADAVVQALQRMEKELERQNLANDKTIPLAEPIRASGRLDTPATGPSRGSVRRAPLIAAGVAALALLLIGIVVFYWQTNNGIVRIEINDPDIQVVFGAKELTFLGADKQHEIKVGAGLHTLHVKRGKDFEFDTDKLLLKRGETITLKVEWFKAGKLQVVQADKVIGVRTPAAVNNVVPDPAMPFLDGHEGLIFGVRFLSDSRRVVSAGWDGKIRLWDTKTGKQLREFSTNHQDKLLNCLAVSADDKFAAAGGSYAGVFLRDLEDSKNSRVLAPKQNLGPVHALAFTPDSQRLLAGFSDGTLCVFLVNNGKLLSQAKVIDQGSISALRVHPDGQRVVCGSGGEPRAVLWDLAKEKVLRTFPGADPVQSVALDREGRRVYLGTISGKIVPADLETGAALDEINGGAGRINSIHVLAGDRLITSSQDKTIRIWDVAGRKEISRFTAEDYVVNISDVSPDGQKLVAGAGWRVFLNLERYKDTRLRQFELHGKTP